MNKIRVLNYPPESCSSQVYLSFPFIPRSSINGAFRPRDVRMDCRSHGTSDCRETGGGFSSFPEATDHYKYTSKDGNGAQCGFALLVQLTVCTSFIPDGHAGWVGMLK